MKNKSVRKLVSLFLASVFFICIGADAMADKVQESIINDKEITGRIERYMSDHNISKNNFSVGFCYTATGDTWYYNGDTWFYPASVYKIPLMMLLAEKVAAGEISQEEKLAGLDLTTAEEYILTYSNNDYAHVVRTYLGGDAVWREDAKKYSTLSDEDYDPDYIDHCYFSNRYITEVVKTLFYEPQRFPNVIDCLLKAEPTHYFRLSMEGKYDIAQKYGSYEDSYGRKFNHTVGIVFADNPCIISVMTCNVDGYEKVISDVAQLMTEYSLELDRKLAAFEAEREAIEQEAKRVEAEKAAELERQKQNEERVKAEAEVKQQAIEVQSNIQTARKTFGMQIVLLAAATVLILILAALIIRTAKHRKRAKRYEQYRRRYEAERRAAQSVKRTNVKNSSYKPKH